MKGENMRQFIWRMFSQYVLTCNVKPLEAFRLAREDWHEAKEYVKE